MRVHRLLVVALAAVTVLGACQVPADDEPRPIAADAVPFGLLDTTTTSPSTTVPPPVQVTKEVYLLEQVAGTARLVRVERTFAADAAGISDVLASLVTTRVTDEESALGYSSQIPEGVQFVGASLDQPTGVLTIQIDGLVGTIAGTSLRLAMGQLVYTATADEDVRSVVFADAAGERFNAVIDNAENVSEPVDRGDYRTISPDAVVEPPATTTTVA